MGSALCALLVTHTHPSLNAIICALQSSLWVTWRREKPRLTFLELPGGCMDPISLPVHLVSHLFAGLGPHHPPLISTPFPNHASLL